MSLRAERSNLLAVGDCFVATNAPRNDMKENILSNMDAEIAALEGKLSTVRGIKAGMMSVLLTPPSVAGQAGG